MFCPNGHPIAAGDRFCTVCGAVAGSTQGQAPPPTQGQAPPPTQGQAPPPTQGQAPPPTQARSRTGLWVMMGLMVVAAAAVAIVFMVTGDSGGGGTAATLPVSSSSPSPTTQVPGAVSTPTSGTSPSSTTTTSLPVAIIPGPVTVSDAVWETVEGGPLGGDGGQSLTDVVVVGTGYLAVGLSGTDVVWTSPDAVSWAAQPAAGLDGAQLLHVEPAPDGTLVGVGHDLSGSQVFAAWTSPDGITWTRQPPATGAVPAGTQAVSDLAAHPDGYVAVGLIDGSGDTDAVWWTSPDGITWSAGTISEPGVQQMLGVAVSDGVMVAAGENRPDTGIWRARVGEEFKPIDHDNLTIAASDFDPANADARVFALDIAVGGPGFVAVGADQTTLGLSAGAAWTSRNGKQWTRFGNETEWTPNMSHADFEGRWRWTVMDTITQSEGTLIVVGRSGFAGETDLVVWESVDGFTWHRGAMGIAPGIQRASNALAQNGKLVVVGINGAYSQTPEADGAVWIATPEPGAPRVGTWREVPRFDSPASSYAGSAAVFDGRIVAVGQSTTDPLVWESTDGIVWSRLAAPQTQSGQGAGLSGVTTVGRKLYVTGEDGGAAIWWSRNLSVWHRATTPAAPGADIDGIWNGQGRLVAYSAPGDVPLLWISSDGRTWTDTAIAQSLDPDSWVAGVSGIADQLVVAVGTPESTTQVWVSPDGNAWTRLPDAPAFDWFWPKYATTFGDRMVISGNVEVDGLWSNAVLATTDLASWDLVVIEASPWVEYESNLGMSVVGSRLYLQGFVVNSAGDSVPVLWSTADLAFWTSAEPLPISGSANDFFPLYGKADEVIRIGDRLVAVGWADHPGEGWYATAWSSDNP